MNSNGILHKHWFHVASHFLTDTLLCVLAFVLGAYLRFGDEADQSIWIHWPSFLLGGIAFSTVLYIAGLYSTHSGSRGFFERTIVLTGCAAFGALIVIASAYTGYARPLGRGVMLLGGFGTLLLALCHHAYLLYALRTARERVAYIVASPFDEVETRLFADFTGHNLEFIGVIAASGYQPTGKARILGSIDEINDIVRTEQIDRVLCTNKNLNNAALTRHFCKLRYSGITVMPLVILCEEVQQCVPLELITHEWLLNASGEPHLLYIKKVKRLFDIIASATGLILSAPLVLGAALLIKLSSPGPIFYRQRRSGRFGRAFEMTKLRTMCTDAEKHGVQWSAKDAEHDPRVFPVGRLLRKYRIDEIPQLWHVLCGDMSFVGPRPERPEIIRGLAQELPFYEERLMIQPGITGWAQVSYPYGASVLDARRKLEYDLYYMKHMSVFLDVFILLDTVRIILTGGVQGQDVRKTASPENMRAWTTAKAVDDAPIALHQPAQGLKLETV